MSEDNKDTITPTQDDVKLLEKHLKKAQKFHRDFHEIFYDLEPLSDKDLPGVNSDLERIASLADCYGYDGNIFRVYSLPQRELLSYEKTLKNLKQQIAILREIIVEINKIEQTKQGWHIKNGQVFYNGKDLQFPGGQVQEVLGKLVKSEGKTVTYDELNEISSLDTIRHYKSNIVKNLIANKVPYEIKNIPNDGYMLQKKSES
jgi:hypothetical protein